MSWLAGLPTADRPGPGYLYLELARRFGGRQMIVDAVGAWAKKPELLPLAAEVLDLATVDRRLGQETRDLIYQWAGKPTGNRAQLVARVCSGDLGRMHTGIALTRLRRLANNCENADRVHVLDALARLAADPATRRQTIDEIMRWYETGPEMAASALHALAAQDLIVPDGEIDEHDLELITKVWTVVLHRPGGENTLTPWLKRISAGTASGGVFLTVVEALLAGADQTLVSWIVLTSQDFVKLTPDASHELIEVVNEARAMFSDRAPAAARIVVDHLDSGEVR